MRAVTSDYVNILRWAGLCGLAQLWKVDELFKYTIDSSLGYPSRHLEMQMEITDIKPLLKIEVDKQRVQLE